jgi:histone deacetylase 11
MPRARISRRALLQAGGILAAGWLGYALLEDLMLDDPAFAEDEVQALEGVVPLIYSPRYNITAFGLEKLHPFDGSKFKHIYNHLLGKGCRAASEFLCPRALTEEDLLRVHSRRYLDSLRDSCEIAKIMEVAPAAWVPNSLLDWRVLRPMRFAAGGTLLACRMALNHGVAINIGGGYHHAEADHGGGFCVYSDVPCAISTLRSQNLVKSALIVDTDAHQGNGFAIEAKKQKLTHVLDLFDETIYPFPKVEEDMSVPFPAHTDGETYLLALREYLPQAIARYEPQLIVYNAGSDVLDSDPLSTFKLTQEEMIQRDDFVVSTARECKIPVAMVLAGGYGRQSASAHAGSIEQVIAKNDRRRTIGGTPALGKA